MYDMWLSLSNYLFIYVFIIIIIPINIFTSELWYIYIYLLSYHTRTVIWSTLVLHFPTNLNFLSPFTTCHCKYHCVYHYLTVLYLVFELFYSTSWLQLVIKPYLLIHTYYIYFKHGGTIHILTIWLLNMAFLTQTPNFVGLL